MKRIIIGLNLLTVSGCSFFSSNGSISVENNTAKVIDSIIVVANGYSVTFYKVPPYNIVHRTIEKRLIKGGHDITMSPTIYDNGKALKGENYYNDLSGFSGDYTIHIYNLHYVKWSHGN